MYATRYDMEDAFGTDEIRQLSDRAHTGETDDAVVTAAIAAACSYMDGYLAGRYALPLTEPYPPVIVATACDLARCRLYDDDLPDTVAKNGDAAKAWLRDVSAGKTQLPLPGTTSNLEIGAPTVAAPARLFDAGTLANF